MAMRDVIAELAREKAASRKALEAIAKSTGCCDGCECWQRQRDIAERALWRLAAGGEVMPDVKLCTANKTGTYDALVGGDGQETDVYILADTPTHTTVQVLETGEILTLVKHVQ